MRPFNTLFLIQSLDGKISTGDNDTMDTDHDFKIIHGIKEGVKQYYDLEKLTDRVSFNSGSVQAKVGVNTRPFVDQEKVLCFAIVDNKPHLDMHGSEYFARRSKVFYLITTNPNHPAFELQKTFDNIEILFYANTIDFVDVFRRFKEEFGIDRVTIQTGGTLNAVLLRLKLIDQVSIVIAPCLIGGKDTASLVDGESLHRTKDLTDIKTLKLVKVNKLEHNFLHLIYIIQNNTFTDPE